MHLRRYASLLVAGSIMLQPASGMFIYYETREVPIGRVFTNLQQRLARNTNDFEVTYCLARLHSMAYATNLLSVPIRADNANPMLEHPGYDTAVPGSVQSFSTPQQRRAALDHLTNAIALYERSIVVLKRSTNTQERTWMVVPTQLGLSWCLDEAGRTNEAIKMYRKTLKLAWHMEVIGDFDFRQWVNDVWDDVRSGRNPVHALRNSSLGPGVCYSEEIIGYLLRLLDPVRDASEVAQLKKDKTTLGTMLRAVTPILIPMVVDARFEDLVDQNAGVLFDLDGSGVPRRWGWLTPKAGWLVFDPNKTGHVSSALQMFGNVTFWIFWPNGYEALAALDDNGDGVISGSELDGLAIWNDRNSDGVSDCGEVLPIQSLGIQSISCASQVGANGLRWNPNGVTFTNAHSRPTYDWIATSDGAVP